eukprot:CAMPEP_0170555162 /NCGR_PEP_ID=MMETSP0211-20121228/13050_1 /TAXON_ID=311385 /ORGANISM="Pseudokeronopsis sp., Strain OXSARD2" /LENGTH=59 /DNA_ID=CAMNT_0010864801 /DNA_START=789 /DNA_END=968 /DNA_ORIENTATION=-
MILSLIEVNGITDKVIHEFEIDFKYSKLLLKYLREKNLKTNLLMRKLIDMLEISRDEEK